MSASCWTSRYEADGYEDAVYWAVDHVPAYNTPEEFDAADDIGRLEAEAEAICLLPFGHSGPHEFVRTDEIVIEFKDAANA